MKRIDALSRVFGAAAVVTAVLWAVTGSPRPAAAATKWVGLKPTESPGRVTLAAGESNLTYHVLDDREPLEFTVTGPRRVKILTRYLYGEKDPEQASYTIRILRDGVETVRRAISTEKSEETHRRPAAGGVGKIRRVYLTVPKGEHTYRVFVVEDDRDVAVRVFRRVKVRETPMASLTPSEYRSVCTLQFASGSLSSYYGFGPDRPLKFEVVGPTRVKVCTRLDFDHTMNGSQSYGLQLFEDGSPVKVYRYHVRKMATVSYVERPEFLPGERKCFWVQVPDGRHLYELGPANRTRFSAAAKLYIPKGDLKRGE